MKVLDEKSTKKVTGGVGEYQPQPDDPSTIYIHMNCGGRIFNALNPFAKCRCSKCGETHYWLRSFKYAMISH